MDHEINQREAEHVGYIRYYDIHADRVMRRYIDAEQLERFRGKVEIVLFAKEDAAHG